MPKVRMTRAQYATTMLQLSANQNLAGDVKVVAFAIVTLMLARTENIPVLPHQRDGDDISARKHFHWCAEVGLLVRPHASPEDAMQWTRYAIREDVPRYEPERLAYNVRRPCEGKLLRPAGAPCGAATLSFSRTIWNPLTGERREAYACSRHQPLLNDTFITARQAWFDNGRPEPKNNRGGHLAKEFSYGNWDELWQWASHGRYKPTEVPIEGPAEPENLAPVINLFAARDRT